ncbi:MAG TPA: MFS transporter [Nocardioidaceae bacterium]
MTARAESRVVNLAGLAQGVTLVTFPAASSVLTDPDEYDLSSTQYGAMFVPQVLTAIAAALLGTALARHITLKRVLVLGLGANIASMLLLLLSTLVKSQTSIAYPLLLVATACLGVGFGLTVPALNTYVALFRPTAADRAVLMLNALLGLGTALAPVFVAVFVGLGFWWGMPVLSAVALTAIGAGCLQLPLKASTPAAGAAQARSAPIPGRFWFFAGFALLYGMAETMNGNWSQLDLSDLGASTTVAAVGLTAFWAMVTVGRLAFAAAERWIPSRVTYHSLPVALAVVFIVIASLPDDTPWLAVVAFGLAGLGCSALLPLTISFGHDALPEMADGVAGGVIAFYQIGYGIVAFGVGTLVDNGRSLSSLYGLMAFVAAGMAVLSFTVTRDRPSLVASSPSAVSEDTS